MAESGQKNVWNNVLISSQIVWNTSQKFGKMRSFLHLKKKKKDKTVFVMVVVHKISILKLLTFCSLSQWWKISKIFESVELKNVSRYRGKMSGFPFLNSNAIDVKKKETKKCPMGLIALCDCGQLWTLIGSEVTCNALISITREWLFDEECVVASWIGGCYVTTVYRQTCDSGREWDG